MTKKEIQALTAQVKVTDEELQVVNNALDSTLELDPEQLHNYIVSFKSVLAKGYKFIDYLNAIKFVTYTQIIGMTEEAAYKAVFIMSKDASKAKITAYTRSPLVREITDMIELPYNLYFAPKRLEVMQNLYNIATDPDARGMVKIKASEVFLNHSAKIFKTEPLVNVEVNNNTQINQLTMQEEQVERMQAFEQFVKAQKTALVNGLSVNDLGKFKP